MDEHSLEKQLQAGNADALPDYLNVIREKLTGYIDKQLGSQLRRKVEAEDLVQEVSAEAVRIFDQIDLSDRPPFAWLCQLAQRRIVDAHRHFNAQKRDAAKEKPLQGGGSGGDGEAGGGLIHMLVASMTTPSQAFSRNVKEIRLQEAIAELGEDQREALRMRYVENKPSKEIAEALGKSDAAVRVILTRAIKKLQQLMGEG